MKIEDDNISEVEKVLKSLLKKQKKIVKYEEQKTEKLKTILDEISILSNKTKRKILNNAEDAESLIFEVEKSKKRKKDELEATQENLQENSVNEKIKQKTKKNRIMEDNENMSEKTADSPRKNKKQKVKVLENVESGNSEMKKLEENEKPEAEKSVEKMEENNGEIQEEKTPSKAQIKKQNHEKRVAASLDATRKKTQMSSLNYLSMWKSAKDNWKFQKTRQVWLQDHLLDEKWMPEDMFPIALEYFAQSMGLVRKDLKKKATSIINKVEENEDTQMLESSEYKRAKQLMKILIED